MNGFKRVIRKDGVDILIHCFTFKVHQEEGNEDFDIMFGVAEEPERNSGKYELYDVDEYRRRMKNNGQTILDDFDLEETREFEGLVPFEINMATPEYLLFMLTSKEVN